MPVITIRGKLGSGAPEIGRLVAESLHIDYIDREIIEQVAARLNLEEQEVVAKEMPPTSLQDRIAEALAHGYTIGNGIQGAYLPIWQIPLDNNRYLEALTGLITELAEGHSAVIYGRGGQFILKNHPSSLHVSIVAPLKVRLHRVMEERNISEEAANKEIGRFDSSAREFMKRFFGVEMEDPTYYDLIINTERYNYQAAVDIIVESIKVKSSQA
ncbi:MAG: cytidylate kinase-like family protein [Dehalococcoidales bacterium]|nr:cytidylate kinase-like family protein [Dehalococcoidales bacterium]